MGDRLPIFFNNTICVKQGYSLSPTHSHSPKASNHQCIIAEILKCTGKEAHAWISNIVDHALQHDMSYDCTTN